MGRKDAVKLFRAYIAALRLAFDVLVDRDVAGEASAAGMGHVDGMDVANNPSSVGDLFATLYRGLGIDPGLQIRDGVGRPHSISGESGKPIAALV